MNKKKLPLFYKIYFSVLAVFVLALTVGCVLLNNFIKDYNEGISETVSQKFFEDNFINLNTDNLISISGIKPCEFETNEDIRSFINQSIHPETLSYTSVSNVGNDEVKKYIVKSGDYKIATFTLAPDEKDDYQLNTLELHLPAKYGKTVKILNSSTLYINGIEVSEDYIINTEPHISAEYLPENVPAPMWVTYSVTGLTKEPEFKITDRNGASPEFSDVGGVLTENVIYDTEETEITSLLLTAAKQYAKCMQNDASKASVLKYFKKNTDLYNSIRTAENTFVWDHSGYSFENESVSEFMRYDENTVSCRISFTHLLHKYGREDYKDFTDITYFAEKIDGEYYIYARYNN